MHNPDLETEIDENTFAKEALQCEIGIKLQQAREAQNISPEHIIKELKFSEAFLHALESGNWANLPGEVYALGFLRQYAGLLGLDVSVEIQRIKSKSFELKAPETYPDVPISPNRKWVYIAIAIFVILMVVVNFSSSDKESEPILEQTSKAATTDKGSLESPVQNIDTYSESLTGEEAKNLIENEPSFIEPAPTKKTYSFFAATNDVWLQVSELDDNGQPQLLREVLLKKGQSFSIIDTTAKLVLTAGNARALEVLEGNQVLFAAGSLGEENKVLKRFPINP